MRREEDPLRRRSWVAAVDAWWRSARGHERALVVSALYLVAWVVLDVLTYRAFRTDIGASVWYPPAAVDLLVLLIFGLRYVPLLLLTSPLHAFISQEQTSLLANLVVDAARTAVVAATVAALLRLARFDPRLPHLRDVFWFVGGLCLIAPLVASWVTNVIFIRVGSEPAERLVTTTLHGWAGRSTGMAMLAPLVLIALRHYPSLWSTPPRRSSDELDSSGPAGLLELGAQLLVLAIAVWAAYALPRGDLDYTYLVYAPMTWIAARAGFLRTCAVLPMLNVGATAIVLRHDGDLRSFALQFGLMTITLISLLLAGVVTEQRSSAARERHNALHDALTMLPNRVLLDDRLRQALARARRTDGQFAVLLLDLDHFKNVNDAEGHLAGDRLLREVARRLRSALRPGDTVARFGGDEFVLLLEDVFDARAARTAAERVRRTLSAPIRLDDVDVHISASTGMVLGPGTRDDPQELLRDADLALHQAKSEGRDRCVLYDDTMHSRVAHRVRIARDLREAIEHERLHLHYQPIVDLASGRVLGAEALLRWNHPQLGSIAPGVFVPLAEESGLVSPLGNWAIRTACAQLSGWQAQGRSLTYVAVNVSPRQLRDSGFRAAVRDALADTGLPPRALQLELTESALLQTTGPMLRTLTALSDDGVTIAIDDFGTGYAALTNLLHVPAGTLKIDRSFVQSSTGRGEGAAVIQAILAMARSLDLDVVAEGVETESELALLRRLGCPKGQGFLLGRPAPPDLAVTAATATSAPTG